jgi:hypothetical protein
MTNSPDSKAAMAFFAILLQLTNLFKQNYEEHFVGKLISYHWGFNINSITSPDRLQIGIFELGTADTPLIRSKEDKYFLISSLAVNLFIP